MQQSVSSSVLAPWVERLAHGARCLWVINRSAGTITWKRRDDYSCFREKSHLTSVFELMAANLSSSSSTDPNDLTLLCKLRSRVMKKYQRYNTAHCWLYKWLFAGQLESTYRTLINRIDTSLYTCLSSCRQVPELGRVNDQERLFSLLIERNTAGQQNESLFIFLNRYPQFLSRVAIETIQTNLSRIPIANLSLLSQVQVAAILPNINAPLSEEGIVTSSVLSENSSEQHANLSSQDPSSSSENATPSSSTRVQNSPGAQRLLAIGIARLREFGLLSRLNLEMFHPDELMQFIGDRQDLIPTLIGSSAASSQNESLFDFADRFPQYLSRIAPEAIQANLSRIPIANLSNLSQMQVTAILPHINVPVLNEGHATLLAQIANPPTGDVSSSSENATPSASITHRNSPGVQRLMAIGIGKLHEFGLLGQVHLGMFHPDEWMQFIGDRQDLVPTLIESSAVSSLGSVFSFTDLHPQFLGLVPVPIIQANLARIPIPNFTRLSQVQVAAILPMINVPVLNEEHRIPSAQNVSSSEQTANSSSGDTSSSSENATPSSLSIPRNSLGVQRLMAIGIAKLHEFGLLSQVHLGMFHPDEWMQFIGDRQDLVPTLIESTIASSQNANLFDFLDRHPQFLGIVPVPIVQANLARIRVPNFSNLSRDQVIAILPAINDPIFEDGGISASFLFNFATWSVGPRRLIAIGIARLYEFGLLGQINLGLFDDGELIQFIGERGDLLPHVEFGGLEASLHRIPIPMIRAFDDPLLQRFSLSLLDEEKVRGIGLQRFAPEQLEQHFRQNPDLLKMVERSRIMDLDVTTLRPSLIAVLYDSLSDFQTRGINLHLLTKEEIAIILDGKSSRIKRLNDWGVAQNYEKLPDETKMNSPQGCNNFTIHQIRAIASFRTSNGSSSSTTNPDSSSSTDL